MIDGPPAVCEGSVFHRRVTPVEHRFTNPVTQYWFDPDRPGQLCGLHPLFSCRRPAPAHYLRADYGTESTGSLADAARNALAPELGRVPGGPVRMLSQLRRWGWLFNPITVFLIWDVPGADTSVGDPVGIILEVTNTPWKERVHYPLVLRAEADMFTGTLDKALHVSPFMEMDQRYLVRLRDRDDRIALDVDVEDGDGPVLHTSLRLDRKPATRGSLGRSLLGSPFATHRVSTGIYNQAARLAMKRVPFVSHPEASATTGCPVAGNAGPGGGHERCGD